MDSKMLPKNYEIKSLKWDTDYFGVSSARLNLLGVVDEQDIKEITKLRKQYKFITVANINNVKENNYWLGYQTNAFLADITLQFKKKLSEKIESQDETTYVTNNFPFNIQVINIASASFNYSRFFNDPYLLQNKKERVYVKWTESAFKREDKYFAICKRDANIAGFVLFSFNEDRCTIELVAVDKNYQGNKVGQTLIQSIEPYIISQGFNLIQVGTQVNNVAAIRFYNKMGYHYINCNSIYHWWK